MRRYHGTMSLPQDAIDQIWNRAVEFDSPAEATAPGDAALHRILVFHGTVQNGGLLNAVEISNDDDSYPTDDVVEAYRFFGLEATAGAIEHAATEQAELAADEEGDVDDETMEEAEERIDASYHLEDSDIEDALVTTAQSDPEAFAPVG